MEFDQVLSDFPRFSNRKHYTLGLTTLPASIHVSPVSVLSLDLVFFLAENVYFSCQTKMPRQMGNDNEFFEFQSHGNDLVAEFVNVVFVGATDFRDQAMHMEAFHEPGDLRTVFPFKLAPQSVSENYVEFHSVVF